MLDKIKRLFTGGMAPSLMHQVLSSGFSFAVGIVAARILGIADFGLFALIYLMSQFLAVAEAHLLSAPMMTLAGAKRGLSHRYYGSIFALSAGLAATSGAILAIMMAGYFWLRGEAIEISPAAIVFFVFAQNLRYMSGRILFAQKQFTRALVLEAARPVLLITFAALFYAYGTAPGLDELLLLLGVSAIAPVIAALLGWINVRPSRRMIKAIAVRHWPLSRWFLLMWFVSIFQEQAIWLMLGIKVGDEAVGALRAVQTLLGLTQVLVLSLENFLPRTAAEAYRGGNSDQLRNYLVRQFALVAGLSLPIIALLNLFAEDVLTLVFGPAFGQFGPLLFLFSIVYFIILFRSMIAHYLRAIEQASAIFKAFLASSVVAAASIVPLLNAYGIEGALFCMMLAQSVCLIGVLVPATVHFATSTACPPSTRSA